MGSRTDRSVPVLKAATLAIALCATQGAAAQALCRDDRVTILGDWGQARFSVEIADEAAERSRGLMEVESMPTMGGMLFVYDAPQRASFWMENTLIPLDMVFAGADGTITRVHENAVPLDRTSIFGGDEVQFVLEINGGMAGRLGIEPGDVIQHPSIGEEAAAPCAAS